MSLYIKIIKSFPNHNHSNIKVLDVGCGNGDSVNYLRKEGFDAYGIDVQYKKGPHLQFLISIGKIRKIIIGGTKRKNIRKNNRLYKWPNFGKAIKIIKSFPNHNHSNIKVLDVGCGNGDSVNYLRKEGFDAYGIDVQYKKGPHLQFLISIGKIRKIIIGGTKRKNIRKNNRLYKWPNFGIYFDIISSRAVLEHVNNLDEFVSESKSNLKNGGICIHYFPCKMSIVEPHIGIPFGGIFKNKYYYIACCYIGLCRKEYYKNPQKAYGYINMYTFYRSKSEIISVFESNGLSFLSDRTDYILKNHQSYFFKFLSNFSFIVWVFGIFRSSVLVFEKKPSKTDHSE